MVTANNVTNLPPELMRRGRFDAIFSTSLPTPHELREVLRIHLGLRGRDIKEFDADEVKSLIARLDGYVPAEVESIVKDGLVDAFSEGEDLTISHIRKAAESMVPLSKAFAVQIEAMNKWAMENATPAGKVDKPSLQSSSPTGRVIRRTRRT
jgi:SpoVK/Ycf46/Vps4 family AAA+-type ATPase